MNNHLKMLNTLKHNVLAGRNRDVGICSGLSIIAETEEDLPFEVLYRIADEITDRLDEWPEGTGCDNYPVPGSRKDKDYAYAKHMYNMTRLDKGLWNQNTEYGQLRWELLEWLIQEYSK